MTPRALRAEIGGAQDQLSDIIGVAPEFFRAPMGFHSPLLDPVLHPFGLRLVTWSRRAYDTVERNPAAVLRRLGGKLRSGDILLMHDANAAETRDGRCITLAVLPSLLARIADLGLRPVTLTDAFAADAPALAPPIPVPLTPSPLSPDPLELVA